MYIYMHTQIHMRTIINKHVVEVVPLPESWIRLELGDDRLYIHIYSLLAGPIAAYCVESACKAACEGWGSGAAVGRWGSVGLLWGLATS